MKRQNLIIFLILFLLTAGLFSPSYAQQRSDEASAYDMLDYYFDLLRSGNYESALGMWAPSALERANRLGIEYQNIPVKPDCNSPVIYDFDQVKENLAMGIKSRVSLDTSLISLQFSLDTRNGMVGNTYYAKKMGDDFWLIFPQDYYAKDWPIYDSKYFRFHVHPKKIDSYNEIAAESLDDYIEKIAEKISIDSDRLALLAEGKIDYYLCLNSNGVANITGQKTTGYYDRAADAIISSNFPEYYLVAQLLTNFKLQNLPCFTLPVVEEGLSIALGGRWQRSSGVILDFGKYILDYDLTDVDSVLTSVASENGTMSDITFPIDACLIDYLLATLGVDKFFNLYLSLSGDINFIRNPEIDSIKNTIAGAYGLGWPEFKNNFNAYISSGEGNGGRIYPGDTQTNQELLHKDGLAISKSNQWLKVVYTGSDQDNPEIKFLFKKTDKLLGKNSGLFEEQFKDKQEFKGYRYGIIADNNEIGLYDYGINQLKGKYVYNFSPNPAYYDSTTKTIRAYFDLGLLKNNLPDASDYEIID